MQRPANLLCIRHTLTRGVRVGLMTGLGAALADTMFAALVAGGFMLAELDDLVAQRWLRVAAGLVLAATGLRSVSSRPRPAATGGRGGFAASFVLAASNPMVLVSIGAVFAAVGLGAEQLDAGEVVGVVVGLALGSTLWWLALASLVGLARQRCPDGLVRRAERVCGVLVVAAGVFAAGWAWIH